MRLSDGTIRKTRISFDVASHAHELTFGCYRRLPLLSKDRTRQWFLDALDQARQRWIFEVWAYVIMPEHVHVLLIPSRPDYRIASFLKGIKQPVGRRAINFLREHESSWLTRLQATRRDGKKEYRFWQAGGGYDRNITEARTAWLAVEYIHNNPVRRGLVGGAVDWPWSSARQYAGLAGVKLAVDGCPSDVEC